MRSLPLVPSLPRVARHAVHEFASFFSCRSRAACHSCTIASSSIISTEFGIRGVYCPQSSFSSAGSGSYRLGFPSSFSELSVGHSFVPHPRVAYSLSAPLLFSSSLSSMPVMQFLSSPFCLRTATPNHALRLFSVRRTPRACHGACDHLRPGRLRASHAVCLASRTLDPSSALEKKMRTSKATRQLEAFWQRVWSCEVTSSTFGRFYSDSTPRVGTAFHVARLGIPIGTK